MDKIDENQREAIFEQKKNLYEKIETHFKLNFYKTSIWELNIYKIFCDIFSKYIKKEQKIQKFLENFALSITSDEIFLFNKKTFLLINSYNKDENENKKDEKIEKICYLMKRLVNNYKNSDEKFKEMTIQNKNNIIYISEFNDYCYIVVILKNKENQEVNTGLGLTKLNIEIGRKIFEEIMNS